MTESGAYPTCSLVLSDSQNRTPVFLSMQLQAKHAMRIVNAIRQYTLDDIYQHLNTMTNPDRQAVLAYVLKRHDINPAITRNISVSNIEIRGKALN